MLRRMALIRTDVSDESCSYLAVSTLIVEVISSSETSALTRVAQRSLPEDDILRSYRGKTLKSYKMGFH
jgi:hypothetical protein